MTTPELTLPCPECEGWGRVRTHYRPGIDPGVPALRCDATGCENGRVTILCDECDEPAREYVEEHPFCREHAAEVRILAYA